jgi:hypothetical protein
MLHAESIQNGGVEYIWDPQLIDVFWPADEYAFIILCRDAKIQQFYVEIREILQNYEQIYLNKQDDSSNAALSFKVEDAIDLNSFLLNVPFGLEFNFDPYTFEVLYDWYLKAPYEKNLVVNCFHLKPKTLPNRKFYKFEQWCREIVWYGHRSGAYIFNHQLERKDESLDSMPGILTK